MRYDFSRRIHAIGINYELAFGQQSGISSATVILNIDNDIHCSKECVIFLLFGKFFAKLFFKKAESFLPSLAL